MILFGGWVDGVNYLTFLWLPSVSLVGRSESCDWEFVFPEGCQTCTGDPEGPLLGAGRMGSGAQALKITLSVLTELTV